MEQVDEKFSEEFNFFKEYVKASVNDQGCMMLSWELPDGDEIYFMKKFKKPHRISPEPFKGARLGDYGYEKAIEWVTAWKTLKDAGLLSEDSYDWEDDYEIYGW